MQRFVFVTRYFYPADTGIARIVSDLAFNLSERGHSVTVLTSKIGYEENKKNLLSKENIQNLTILRLRELPFKRTSLVGRLINYLIFYISCLYRLPFLIKRNDRVIVLSEPPLASVMAYLTCALRQAKLINWLQDIHPEISIRLGVPFLQGKIGRFIQHLRNHTLKKARSNLVLGEKMSEFVASLGVSPSLIHIFSNWEDGQLIKPLPTQENPLRKEWQLHDKFVIGYSGNFGRAHDFSTVLGVATRFNKNESDIVFLFIGDGYARAQVEQEVLARKLNNVIFKPYQPREQLRESLGVPDVHFMSALPAIEGLLVPAKCYSALAAGRPIIFVGDKEGEISRILRKANCGEAIDIGDAEGFAKALLKIKNDPQLKAQRGNNARQYFEKYCDRSIVINELSLFLEAI